MRLRTLLALALLLGLLIVAWAALSTRHSAGYPTIHGQVADQGGFVEGARVRIKGQASFAVSDRLGRFRLTEHPGPSVHVTASKPGYFIAGSRANRKRLHLVLNGLPANDCEGYHWVDPGPDPAHVGNCANCHAEIYREWSASSHAGSVTNRRFLNLYDGTDWQGRPHVGWDLLRDHPAGAGVCNACHAPTASFDADLRQATGVTQRGVHCDFCHKVADASTANLGLTHGRFGLQLLRPSKGQLFFGPLDDVDRNEDSFSPLYQESRYCASCHEGVVFGVHVYSTYSEWLASPAQRERKQCQTCHMRPTGMFTNIAPAKGGVERDPSTLASHRFLGGQADMLRRSLRISATLEKQQDETRADVAVVAHAVGHRVPTGFVDRNVLVVVEAFDDAGRSLPLRAGPRLSGLAGPTAGLPGKLYAKHLKDFHGASPAPFWLADPDLVDTRLLPEQPDRLFFCFPSDTQQIRLRLVYRRFWPEVADTKGWSENEIVVLDQTLPVLSDRPTHWSSP
jgi:hypothetical protein